MALVIKQTCPGRTPSRTKWQKTNTGITKWPDILFPTKELSMGAYKAAKYLLCLTQTITKEWLIFFFFTLIYLLFPVSLKYCLPYIILKN